jgi:hypothetical protein
MHKTYTIRNSAAAGALTPFEKINHADTPKGHVYIVSPAVGGVCDVGAGPMFSNAYTAMLKHVVDAVTLRLNPWLAETRACRCKPPPGASSCIRHFTDISVVREHWNIIIPYEFTEDLAVVNRLVYTTLSKWNRFTPTLRAEYFARGRALDSDAGWIDTIPIEQREAAREVFTDSTYTEMLVSHAESLVQFMMITKELMYKRDPIRKDDGFLDALEYQYAQEFLKKPRQSGPSIVERFAGMFHTMLLYVIANVNRGFLGAPPCPVITRELRTKRVAIRIPAVATALYQLAGPATPGSVERRNERLLLCNHNELSRLILKSLAFQNLDLWADQMLHAREHAWCVEVCIDNPVLLLLPDSDKIQQAFSHVVNILTTKNSASQKTYRAVVTGVYGKAHPYIRSLPYDELVRWVVLELMITAGMGYVAALDRRRRPMDGKLCGFIIHTNRFDQFDAFQRELEEEYDDIAYWTTRGLIRAAAPQTKPTFRTRVAPPWFGNDMYCACVFCPPPHVELPARDAPAPNRAVDSEPSLQLLVDDQARDGFRPAWPIPLDEKERPPHAYEGAYTVLYPRPWMTPVKPLVLVHELEYDVEDMWGVLAVLDPPEAPAEPCLVSSGAHVSMQCLLSSRTIFTRPVWKPVILGV